MKTWSINKASLVSLIISSWACAPSEQELNKRQAKLGKLAELGSKNAQPAQQDRAPDEKASDVVVEPLPPPPPAPVAAVPLSIPELKYPELKLTAAKGFELLKAEDIEGIQLISKVSASESIIFGKDGKSWSYKAGNGTTPDVLKLIDPAVLPLEGSTLYTLPDQELWLISNEKLARRKPSVEGAPVSSDKTITLEQFSTSNFAGDKTKMKVLYVALDEVILHLGTHIVILKANDSPARITQLDIAKLPVDLKGDVQAGRTDSGFWFRANGSLFLYAKEEKAGISPWSKGPLTLEPADTSALSLWVDASGSIFSGVSLGLSAKTFFSNAPVPAPTAALQ